LGGADLPAHRGTGGPSPRSRHGGRSFGGTRRFDTLAAVPAPTVLEVKPSVKVLVNTFDEVQTRRVRRELHQVPVEEDRRVWIDMARGVASNLPHEQSDVACMAIPLLQDDVSLAVGADDNIRRPLRLVVLRLMVEQAVEVVVLIIPRAVLEPDEPEELWQPNILSVIVDVESRDDDVQGDLDTIFEDALLFAGGTVRVGVAHRIGTRVGVGAVAGGEALAASSRRTPHGGRGVVASRGRGRRAGRGRIIGRRRGIRLAGRRSGDRGVGACRETPTIGGGGRAGETGIVLAADAGGESSGEGEKERQGEQVAVSHRDSPELND